MSLTRPTPPLAGELERKWRAQLAVPVDRVKLLADLRREIRQYEERYGIASERIHEAIDSGDLVEDQDVGHWIFQYTILCSVEVE